VALALSMSLLHLPSVAASDAAVPVLFSHCYVTVSSNTYESLRASKELAALAKTEELHVNPGDQNEWTALYVRGRQTHIEFQTEPVRGDGHVYYVGLALMVERPGDLGFVAGRLRPAFGDRITVDVTQRTIASRQVPWFSEVDLEGRSSDGLFAWVMELEPGYIHAVRPQSDHPDPFTRAAYEGNLQGSYLLDDIAGLTIALRPAASRDLVRALRLLGWHVARSADAIVAGQSKFQITIVEARHQEGIRQIDVALRTPIPKNVLTFGDSALYLEGDQGHFQFPDSPEPARSRQHGSR
jgi:hypothetical protein